MVYRENPIKIDDLGVPLFEETSFCEKSEVGKLGKSRWDNQCHCRGSVLEFTSGNLNWQRKCHVCQIRFFHPRVISSNLLVKSWMGPLVNSGAGVFVLTSNFWTFLYRLWSAMTFDSGDFASYCWWFNPMPRWWFGKSTSCFHLLPIRSMHGIYANMWGILMVNVTIYDIHTDPSWVGKNNPNWRSRIFFRGLAKNH